MENDRRAKELIDELSAYIYGLLFILGFAAVMLLIHLGIDFFFHN